MTQQKQIHESKWEKFLDRVFGRLRYKEFERELHNLRMVVAEQKKEVNRINLGGAEVITIVASSANKKVSLDCTCEEVKPERKAAER
jgi:ubiquinone biosynthesis protein UbiJ